MIKQSKGITLVALVITIVILLILAGISISQLTGSGLFENAKLSKEKSTRAEMKESLTLALQELQIEKKGKATIDDITQEWIDSKLTEYKNTVIEDAEENSKTIKMEKNGIIVNYILDEKLGVTELTVQEAKFKIEVTDPIVSTNTTATKSDEPGLLARGTASYINFTTTLDVNGGECTISPELPYKVLGNGTYTFTISGTYDETTITKEVKVNVNQYVAPIGVVQYDAGDWTEEEIEELQSKCLYDINISKTIDSTFKLTDSAGLNFTFGGFTYKGDTTNLSYINDGTITTSRNKSVSSSYSDGVEYFSLYDGWQILTTEIKTDENGNIIKNEDGTDRVYVTKITHAGAPENFVFKGVSSNDGRRAEYILSNGERENSYNKLNSGEVINTRNWDMYRDKELDEKEYIKNVHVMTYQEAYNITKSTSATTGIRMIGMWYWLATADSYNSYGCLRRVNGNDGNIIYACDKYTWGIRPIVEMNDGVYIASGDGTAESPYILGKE